MAKTEPIIKFETEGTASVISYNVPEPTSYTGRNFIELGLSNSYFTSVAFEKPEETGTNTGSSSKFGVFTYKPFAAGSPKVPASPAKIKKLEAPKPAAVTSTGATLGAYIGKSSLNWTKSATGSWSLKTNLNLSKSAMATDPENLMISAQTTGKIPVIQKNLYGTYDVSFYTPAEEATPQIVLVETYRLSSYLGNYGAGRVIKTFSLFPGEKTTISVKTYKSTESTETSASSILDSFTEESSSEFENAVSSEQTSSEASSKASQYSVEAEASASWGWGSASVSGSYGGSTQSSREDTSKNISSATEKTAASASAKREVQVETSYEVKTTEGEETSITREFQNINVGRTLNFVFRQMNQEFFTILHLVDVRIAFFNGFPEKTDEMTLPNLDKLLEKYIVSSKRAEVKSRILNELKNILDYQDTVHNIIEKRTLTSSTGSPYDYYRIKKDIVMQYDDPATGSSFSVPGVIMNVKKIVMRTEGVIVESLLGQAPALDPYSEDLQNETIRTKKLENDKAALENEKQHLAIDIVTNKDTAAAAVFEQVFNTDANDDEETAEE